MLCALVSLAAPACDDRRISLVNVEQILAEEYAAKSGKTVESVRCPERVPTRKGHRFDCTVVFAPDGKDDGKVDGKDDDAGRELVIDVEQLGGTQLRWQPREPIAWLPEARAAIQQALADKGLADTEFVCPPLAYVSAGRTLTCVVPGADGRAGRIEYTLDRDGKPSITVESSAAESSD